MVRVWRMLSTAALAALFGVATHASSAVAEPEPASPTPAASIPADITIEGEGDFARILLRAGGWPVTGDNVCAVVRWEIAEGGHFVPTSTTFNPLNTGHPMPGDSIFNSHGVRNYPDWPTGITATLETLQLDFYAGIRAALANGSDGRQVLAAVTAAPWGTKFPDPGAALAPCAGWADEFDRARADSQSRIDAAAVDLSRAQARHTRVLARQAGFDARHAAMAGEIDVAKRSLSRFARDLYIDGVEPAVASHVDAFTSSDPIQFQILQEYPNVVARRHANDIEHSAELLRQVDAQRDAATAAATSAMAAAAAAESRLAAARSELDQIEYRAAELN